ncbi:septin-1-like [Perca fluviatilis]|uniref:septin-1-like n=1 Tax=Perca fluviatilis TaxID=8168 RepID=UPI00196243AB|nr:septin-1-like [Perca fluviatilis]
MASIRRRSRSRERPPNMSESVTMATNTSSKYDNIPNKVLIQSGSPAVYQLTPKKEKIGPLTRITFGEKDPNKENKTILLVGEKGTGKSSLINSLVNYAMGVEWEDDVWFQIVEETKSQSESQTSDVMVYQIFGFEDKTLPYSLTIIDTPGYGDTRGIKHDMNIMERLFDLFRSEDGVHEINAVGLVMKASENRLSDRQRYIFDSMVSLFGKDMEKNIVALITHSDGRTPKKALEAAKIKCASNEKNQPVHFLFNNHQNEDRAEDEEALKHADKISMKGMNQFTNFLVKTEPQRLETTMNVLKGRIRLTACINNLQERIKLINLKQREIQQTQDGLKKYEREMKKNEKFTVEVDEVYKDKEPVKGGRWGLGLFYEGATCCTVCEETCHHPGCTVAMNPSKCEFMENGRCTSCTGKCPVSDHVKEEWMYVKKTRKVIKTLEDVKAKYETNKTETNKLESILETLQREKETLETTKTRLLDEAYQHVVKLEENALNVVSLSTNVHLDFLIEEMEMKHDTEKVNHLKQIKSKI